jgi:hypothetical protein
MTLNQRSAFVVINGLQLIQCVLPSRSEGSCTVYADAADNLYVMNDYGRLEISCVFYSSADVVDELRPWVATLTADAEEIALGQLPRAGGRTRVVSQYMRSHPRSLKLTVTYKEASAYAHPEEQQLIEFITTVMLNDHFKGEVPGFVRLSHLQHKLEGVEQYKRVVGSGKVVGHYQRNLQRFIACHPQSFSLLQIAGQEVLVGLSPSAAAAAETEPSWTLANPNEQDTIIVAEMEKVLQDGPVDMSQLLAQLQQNPSTRPFFRASSNNVVQFLKRHHQTFYIRSDPVHTTRVGCRRFEEDG